MDDRLREIEERLAKASPEPWFARPEYHINGGVVPHRDVLTESANPDEAGKRIAEVFGPNDFDFIAHARDDILYLLQQVREAREALGQIANHDRGTETFGEGEDAEWETCEECLDMQAIARAALGGKP